MKFLISKKQYLKIIFICSGIMIKYISGSEMHSKGLYILWYPCMGICVWLNWLKPFQGTEEFEVSVFCNK